MIAAGIIRAGIAMRQTVKNRPKRETKRWKTSAGRGLAACLLAVCALCGCVGRTEPADSPPVLPAGTEEVTGEVFPRYEVQTVSVSKGKEAVLVQQVMGGGLLVIINRVLREEIPEELLEDPDFVNDGRYAVTEDKIFTLLPDGRRRLLSRYRKLEAPEDGEDRKEYFSESRIRAVRSLEGGGYAAVESSFESWQNETGTPRYQTLSRYFLRILQEDGEALETNVLETEENGLGPDFTQLAVLEGNVLAVPQGNAVLFFGTDGKRLFTVETPFPVSELCGLGGGKLAVVLQQGESSWFSLIDAGNRSVTVPAEIPADAHSFRSASGGSTLCCIRRSEVFTLNPESCELRKLVSLYSLGVNPSALGALEVKPDGVLILLTNTWNPDSESVEIRVLTASPQEPEAAPSPSPERTVLTMGFLNLSDRLEDLLLRFNARQDRIRIEAVDYGNLTAERMSEDCPDILVMDDPLYRRLAGERKLADLSPHLSADVKYAGEIPESVRNALSEEDGSLRRIAGVFRLESMACDADTVDGRSQLSMDELRALLSEMPAGSMLYEPYYTYDRLLSALTSVNRRELVADGQQNAALYAELQAFASLQPLHYDYSVYAADTASMESRIYDGRLLMLQAHIGSLEELKWYDAFFPSGASFAGWPTESGSRSLFCFDEQAGVAAHCGEEKQNAAWEFIRCLLEEEYCRESYGFPVSSGLLNRILDEDAAAVSYRLDEKGRFELDDDGEKIERPRSTWYSPEWRRHYDYALTESQRDKLMTMIENAA